VAFHGGKRLSNECVRRLLVGHHPAIASKDNARQHQDQARALSTREHQKDADEPKQDQKIGRKQKKSNGLRQQEEHQRVFFHCS
jgi:hypothetical protein